MRRLWVIEDAEGGPGSWSPAIHYDRIYYTKREAMDAMRELRLEADLLWDGPYRLVKYVPANEGKR